MKKGWYAKHWRAVDFSYILLGLFLFIMATFFEKPYGIPFMAIGIVLVVTGIISNAYDEAIEKAGCMEKVAREL